MPALWRVVAERCLIAGQDAGMTDHEHVLTERRGPVLTVTLNRPERLNAFDSRMSEELLDVVRTAELDDRVRVVLLTGAGRGFCAGADVSGLASLARGGGSPASVREGLRASSVPVARALLEFEKPMVAAVNGPCAGAGVGIALACDVVVASEAATFTIAFVRRGLVPDYGVTYLLPRLIGLRAARELCLLGDTIDAAQADSLGMVTTVVTRGTLMDVAAEYAERLAEGAGVALRLTKRLLAGSYASGVGEAVDAESSAQALAFGSADAAEGAAAFLEKRPARFTWR
jgi:2-(1,2-epoxy-1,2-dihydrophenyl)acetyl-CoA isomerase